jgi:hypothetical protein
MCGELCSASSGHHRVASYCRADLTVTSTIEIVLKHCPFQPSLFWLLHHLPVRKIASQGRAMSAGHVALLQTVLLTRALRTYHWYQQCNSATISIPRNLVLQYMDGQAPLLRDGSSAIRGRMKSSASGMSLFFRGSTQMAFPGQPCSDRSNPH